MRRPFDDQLGALIHEPTFRSLFSGDIFLKIRSIKDIGNLAVHSTRPISQNDALRSTTELFHFLYWLARTYTKGDPRKLDNLKFNAVLAPPAPASVIQQTVDELQKLQAELQEKDNKLLENQRKLEETDSEVQRLRAEIAHEPL